MRILASLWLLGCGATPAPAPSVVPPPPSSVADAATAAAPAPVRVGTCGQGDYLVGPPADYATKRGTGGLELGHLNPDGHVDLIVGGKDDAGKAQLAVLLNTGEGTFRAPISYPLLPGGEAHSIALTDFDTDEDLDIVAAGGSGTPQIFLNNGDGTFGPPVALPARSVDVIDGPLVVVRVADIHGDAHPDVVTYAGGGFDVWHDAGHAVFTVSQLPPIERLEHGAGLAIADFDHDGATDIAVAGTDRGAAVVVVLISKRGGNFAAPVRYPTGASGAAIAVVSADFNGDGKPDLAAMFAGGQIAVLYGNGNGSFRAGASLAVADPGTRLIAADLNADGRADLVASTAHGLAVFLANGGGLRGAGLDSRERRRGGGRGRSPRRSHPRARRRTRTGCDGVAGRLSLSARTGSRRLPVDAGSARAGRP